MLSGAANHRFKIAKRPLSNSGKNGKSQEWSHQEARSLAITILNLQSPFGNPFWARSLFCAIFGQWLRVGHVGQRLPPEPLKALQRFCRTAEDAVWMAHCVTHYNWAFEMNYSSDESWGLLQWYSWLSFVLELATRLHKFGVVEIWGSYWSSCKIRGGVLRPVGSETNL